MVGHGRASQGTKTGQVRVWEGKAWQGKADHGRPWQDNVHVGLAGSPQQDNVSISYSKLMTYTNGNDITKLTKL